MLSFMFCIFTFGRELRFWSGLLVLKFTAAVGVFTWAYQDDNDSKDLCKKKSAIFTTSCSKNGVSELIPPS